MSNEINITEENFNDEVVQSDKPVIIDFWATWCGPCLAFGPVLEQYAEQHPEIKVCKLNVDDAPGIAQQFNVMSIPTIIFFNKGQAVETAVGSMSLSTLEERAVSAFA
ncbi:thioredoxin [bacterium]|nr:thioredoxin [bacterium]